MSKPSMCDGCRFLNNEEKQQTEGHCYMFETPPKGFCAQHKPLQIEEKTTVSEGLMNHIVGSLKTPSKNSRS